MLVPIPMNLNDSFGREKNFLVNWRSMRLANPDNFSRSITYCQMTLLINFSSLFSECVVNLRSNFHSLWRENWILSWRRKPSNEFENNFNQTNKLKMNKHIYLESTNVIYIYICMYCFWIQDQQLFLIWTIKYFSFTGWPRMTWKQ